LTSQIGTPDSAAVSSAADTAASVKSTNETGYSIGVDPESLYNPGFPSSGDADQREGLLRTYSDHDISNAAKSTLGSYLSNASRGAVYRSGPNKFQIPAESADLQGTGLTVNTGLSSRTDPQTARSQVESAGTTIGTFLDLAKAYQPDAADRFNSTKDSQYASRQNPFTETDIKKVGSPERSKGLDGNSLLTNIVPVGRAASVDLGAPTVGDVPPTAPTVQKKISAVLSQNRFNPIERAFIQDHTRKSMGYTVQKRMGSYIPTEEAPEVSEDRLKKVGLHLMIRSTGHGIPGVDLLDSTNDMTAMNNLAPLLPTLSQFSGLPVIDTVNLRAGNVPVTDSDGDMRDFSRAEYTNPENPEWSVFANKSYGVLNSHIEPFDGPLPIGTLTTTVAGILAIVGFSALIGGIGLLFNTGNIPGQRQQFNYSNPIDLRLGRRGKKNDDLAAEFFLELFGIPKTDHNWGECVFAGIGAFFGLSQSPGAGITLESVLESAFNIAMAPGYYAVVIRNAIRDTEQIVESIENFGSNFASENIVKAISDFFKIVEAITSSAIYKFLIAMVRLGNQVLNSNITPHFGSTPIVDDIVYNGATRQMKSRIVKYDNNADVHDIGRTNPGALAWKHSSPGSRYLAPESFLRALDSYRSAAGGNAVSYSASWKNAAFRPGEPIPNLQSGKSSSARSENKNRLPEEYVREIEDTLESEYLPFYFQDLRTNEIIAFHGFLSDLSDGFSANYNNTSGYGRIDEVMVYSSTKRSISLEFIVAATSKEDLDVMYWNINKLVTMLYPQFSRGRTMVNGIDRFIQPFSQIPTASPMIRLRVGDIVKGNYSKFGIARLFGLGQDPEYFNMDRTKDRSPPPTPPPSDELRSRADQYAETQINNRISAGWQPGDVVSLADIPEGYLPRNAAGLTAVITSPDIIAPPEAQAVHYLGTSPDVTIQRVVTDSTAIPSSSPRPTGGAAGAASRRRRGRRAPPAIDMNFDVNYLVSVNESFRLIDNPEYAYHQVSIAQIETTGPTIERLRESFRDQFIAANSSPAAASPSAVGPPNDQALHDFLSSENNPIIRSFESTRGRGLAGFITDMKFNWQESTWETSYGQKAPKMIKISMTFNPIHDIPMGLDSDGMMRSVAYNVGSYSNSVGRDAYENTQDVIARIASTSSEALSGDEVEPG